MRCDEVKPNLLDYSEGLLSGSESEEVAAHLSTCNECRALLEEEAAFSRRLAGLPDEEPENDVWALVRAETKPRLSALAWLRNLLSLRPSRVAAAVGLAAIMTVSLYVANIEQPRRQAKPPTTVAVKTVKWTDDPIGDHTDAVVDYINANI